MQMQRPSSDLILDLQEKQNFLLLRLLAIYVGGLNQKRTTYALLYL
jgi:hypothetical protein